MYILSTNCLRFNSASKREQRMLAYYAEREQNRRSQCLMVKVVFHLNKQLVYLSTCQLVNLSYNGSTS